MKEVSLVMIILLKMNPVNEYLGPILDRLHEHPDSLGQAACCTAPGRADQVSPEDPPGLRTGLGCQGDPSPSFHFEPGIFDTKPLGEDYPGGPGGSQLRRSRVVPGGHSRQLDRT